MPVRFFITGATGFVGSHLAEACVARGDTVSTVARPTSDTALLDHLGASVFRGELTDAALLERALEGAEVVVHCAAKVGDWGPIEDYRLVNVQALRSLLEACKGKPPARFVHISTLGVYAARHHYGTDETEPLPARHIDGYTQTKVEAERLVLNYYHSYGIPAVILRPGVIYGPRERTVVPRIIELLRERQLPYLGGGKGAMNCIYVSNLVDAILLAVAQPKAVGQVYNLTDGEFVSKRRFIEAIADGLGLEKPTRSVPLWLARIVAFFMERRARRRGASEAPRLTQARLKLFGLNLEFRIDKAKRELGYQPRTPFEQAMQETIAWYRQNA